MGLKELFKENLKVVNIGSPVFKPDYEKQKLDFVDLDWAPPANGNTKTLALLNELTPYEEKINFDNQEFIKQVRSAEGRLIAVKKAMDVIPNMTRTTILHAGPSVSFKDMAGPMKGAIIGALIYEGLATNEKDALKLIASGKIEFDSCHNHDAVGPMAGIISASMPVHVLFNIVHKNYAYCTINEGLGKVLRYGANNDEVINRLKFLEKTFMPIMNEALKINGGIDVKSIIIQALQMGDECHNRNKAATAIFLREIVLDILKINASDEDKNKVIEFIKLNEHYFLNLSMPYCKLALETTKGLKYSTLLRTMSRNGFEFGVRLPGSDTWYKGQANYVKGLMFPGFKPEDAARDIGDSAITETFGIGGFAMGGAPAIVQFVGGNVSDAFNYSKLMHEITESTHQVFTLPTLDFMPTGLGIDIRKVLETNILPIINTGMAHKEPGIGQVGAGLVTPPIECFEKALEDFVKIIKES